MRIEVNNPNRSYDRDLGMGLVDCVIDWRKRYFEFSLFSSKNASACTDSQVRFRFYRGSTEFFKNTPLVKVVDLQINEELSVEKCLEEFNRIVKDGGFTFEITHDGKEFVASEKSTDDKDIVSAEKWLSALYKSTKHFSGHHPLEGDYLYF